MNVGSYPPYEFGTLSLIEQHSVVHHLERGNDGRALLFWTNGALWPFQLVDGFIAVDAYHQDITLLFGNFQHSDMSQADDVKAAIGADYHLTRFAMWLQFFLQVLV